MVKPHQLMSYPTQVLPTLFFEYAMFRAYNRFKLLFYGKYGLSRLDLDR